MIGQQYWITDWIDGILYHWIHTRLTGVSFLVTAVTTAAWCQLQSISSWLCLHRVPTLSWICEHLILMFNKSWYRCQNALFLSLRRTGNGKRNDSLFGPYHSLNLSDPPVAAVTHSSQYHPDMKCYRLLWEILTAPNMEVIYLQLQRSGWNRINVSHNPKIVSSSQPFKPINLIILCRWFT